MANIITMGEMLMRLSTKNHEKFLQAADFNICYGGSESNVAISLANFGHNVSYITKLPNTPIGHSAAATLKNMAWIQEKLFMQMEGWEFTT